MRTEIIAELGSIAEGRLDVMLRQVDVAQAAGADAVKLQWLSSPARLVERRHAEGYAGAYQHLAYPLGSLRAVVAYARGAGLKAGCSVYLSEDVAVLAPLVDFLKVASFEAGDVQLLGAIAATKARRVIVSSGMSDGLLPCVALDALIYDCASVSVLHCVSAYPAPVDACNLALFARPDDNGMSGFSDHTAWEWTGAIAVAAGARILEAHLRLDDTSPQHPDYACALDPAAFAAYVRHVRVVETMMGDGVKRMQDCEAEMMQYRVTA